MPDGVAHEAADEPPDGSADDARRAARRRRRLAEVFGDPLPDTTSDERDPQSAQDAERGDTWLREQVPPHHGPG